MDGGFKCKFKCVCGTKEFMVRWRRPKEDIAHYMEQVIRPGLGVAHGKLSPQCKAPTCDLLLPVPENAEGIGMRPKLDS